ncbi:MAG: extragenic suppressor protein suhB [Thermoproteus sp.]|nr:extragenic suppressor protein suhB [Thermoproteus sp.]
MLGRLEAIAAKASWMLWSYFKDRRGKNIVGVREGDVTRAVDAEMEEYIYKMLKSSFEGGVLIAEEGGVYRWGDERYVFVVDPLDGSLNYSLGIPIFAISIAGGRRRDETLADLEYGVLAVPSTGDIYSYSPEAGALKNGRSLQRRTEASNVVFAAMGEAVPAAVFEKMASMGLKGRSLGCSSLELLLTALNAAVGFVDFRRKLRALDIAASLVIGRAMGLKYVIWGDHSLHAKGISILAGSDWFINEFRGLGGGG